MSQRVRRKPLPKTPVRIKRNRRQLARTKRGDLLIRGFVARGTDCILDVHVIIDEYRRQILQQTGSSQSARVATEGKETEVFGGMMHRTMLPLHPFCLLSEWFARMRGQNLRRTSYLPSLRANDGRSPIPKYIDTSMLD